MAAGLPVVVSDWDGYKDTVRHNIDGFRLPVITPGAGSGEDLAWRFERGEDDYDRYIGTVSLCTAIDVDACTTYILRLIENPALRASMGQAARERARSDFDWKHIVRAYQELWHELEIRRHAGALAAREWPSGRI